MTADARIDEIRAWLSTLPEYTTHSADCWRWHPRCVARLLLAEIDRNTLHLNAADSLAFAEALIAADEREAALIRVSQIGEAMNIGCGTADCLTDYTDLIERLEKAADALDAPRGTP